MRSGREGVTSGYRNQPARADFGPPAQQGRTSVGRDQTRRELLGRRTLSSTETESTHHQAVRPMSPAMSTTPSRPGASPLLHGDTPLGIGSGECPDNLVDVVIGDGRVPGRGRR